MNLIKKPAAISAAVLVSTLPLPALAQSAGAGVSFEATTDLRERGLSWSDGRAALTADGTIPVLIAENSNVLIDVGAATLRESARHGGSSVGLTVSPSLVVYTGGWSLAAGITGHAFIGDMDLSYAELDARFSRSIGPAELAFGASFAPSQSAIGGSNLYLEANAALGIPGTALTLYGGGGYSTGSRRDSLHAWERAQRLRPEGSYWDHYLGIEHLAGRMAVGMRYSGTSIDGNLARGRYTDEHAGSRLTAYVRFTP